MTLQAKSRISFLREKAGLTQLELSRLVNVTETTIQNWEKGRAGVEQIERIIKLCKALQCNLEELVEYVSAEPKPVKAKARSLAEMQELLDPDKPFQTTKSKAKRQRKNQE
jgi:transcriptional regulator with XRE-family HTH domain